TRLSGFQFQIGKNGGLGRLQRRDVQWYPVRRRLLFEKTVEGRQLQLVAARDQVDGKVESVGGQLLGKKRRPFRGSDFDHITAGTFDRRPFQGEGDRRKILSGQVGDERQKSH